MRKFITKRIESKRNSIKIIVGIYNKIFDL